MLTAGTTSGTYSFTPDIASLLREAYSRVQIYPPQMTILHLSEARMSLNLILMDIGGNEGPNLWAVDQIQIPLAPGKITYTLSANTVDLLDCYIRTYAPNLQNNQLVTTSIGNPLTALGPAANPLVALPYGDPLLIQPASGVFSCVAGSQTITMIWPSHGQSSGNPLFWGCPISIGGIVLDAFSIVDTVLGPNQLTFQSAVPALETQTNQGATPLLFAAAGSSALSCILPGHGLSVGSTFTVPIFTTVGTFTLPAASTYTVTAVDNSYQFEFAPGGVQGQTAMAFMNSGLIPVGGQLSNAQFIDVPLYPISRTDYVNLGVKNVPGRPTSYWLDRIVPPQFSIYPVTPPPTQGNYYYAFIGYRMREIQDANPIGGQILDAPRRMLPALTALLCAAVAEKFKPAMFAEKAAIAEKIWLKARDADIEHVTTRIAPNVGSYFGGGRF